MASSVSLACYTIRVKDKVAGKWAKLGSTCKGLDTTEVLKQYLATVKRDPAIDEKEKQIIETKSVIEDGRRLYGILDVGAFGITSQLRDVEKQEVAYNRKTSDAEMFPFYFLMEIPKDKDKGIVVLQRMGNFGIRKLLLQNVGIFFEKLCPDHSIQISPLAPGKLFDQYYSHGRVTKVRLIQYRLPSDIADLYSTDTHIESEAFVEYVVHARRNKSLPIVARVKSVLDGKLLFSKLVEIQDIVPDQVKIEIEVNKRKRTLDLGHKERIRAYVDVTDEVKFRGGHPTFDSIHSVALDLLTDLNKTLWGAA